MTLKFVQSISVQQLQIIYKSKASRGFNPLDFKKLSLQVIQNNKMLDINGGLMMYNDHFFQCIEGEEETLSLLFENIKKDKRHFALDILKHENIVARLNKQKTKDLLEKYCAQASHLEQFNKKLNDVKNTVQLFKSYTDY